MRSSYKKPIAKVRPIWGGQSLLASSDITITKGNGTYSGAFHAKRFVAWDDEESPSSKGNNQ